jgi:hypothetical protein
VITKDLNPGAMARFWYNDQWLLQWGIGVGATIPRVGELVFIPNVQQTDRFRVVSISHDFRGMTDIHIDIHVEPAP